MSPSTMQRLRVLLGRVMDDARDADREERLEALRGTAEYHESKAREARRQINLVMSEPIVAKMREMGL